MSLKTAEGSPPEDLATFDMEAVASDHDFFLYSIADKAGRFVVPQIRGCIRDSDVRAWT